MSTKEKQEIDKKILLIMPAYNEEKTIAPLILEAEKYVDEILVVDDGSKDHTAEIAQRMGATVIKHPENMGKGIALKSGFTYALKNNPNIVITMDADGQHDPKFIPQLIQPIIENKADIVIGSRYVKGASMDAPLYRRIGLRIVNLLNKKIANLKVKDTQSGYRAYTLNAVKIISQYESSGYGVETEQLILAQKHKLRIIEIPIKVTYRGLEKTSKKHPVKHGGELISTIIKLIVEERPLLTLGLPGGILTAIGIILATYLILIFNTTRYFSIPIALITLGTIFIGLILVIASLILYALNRIFKRLKI